MCSETFPGFAVIDEDTGMINELEDAADYLFEAVGSVTGGSVVTAIFDPVEKVFNPLANIIRGAKKTASFS